MIEYAINGWLLTEVEEKGGGDQGCSKNFSIKAWGTEL